MIKEVYKNYYLDFVMFNYTIDEFLEAAVDDYGDVSGSGGRSRVKFLNF